MQGSSPTHPNLSALTFLGASQEVALRGQGGLGSCLRATEFKILQKIPALSSTGHSDASMDQFWRKLIRGRVTGQQPLGHPSDTCQSLPPCRASRHSTLTPAIHQASSVSSQLLVLNLMSAKYFGFKLFLSLPFGLAVLPRLDRTILLSVKQIRPDIPAEMLLLLCGKEKG